MPFTITLGFAAEHDRDAFIEKVVPKVRGHAADPAPGEEGDALHKTAVAVTSQTAAKELCHLIVAFLAHSKSSRVVLIWPGAGGEPQAGEVNAGTGAAREAEVLAMRLGPAAKAFMDHEKADSQQLQQQQQQQQ